MLSHDPYDPETNTEGKIVFYPKLVFPESFLAVQLSRSALLLLVKEGGGSQWTRTTDLPLIRRVL